LQALTILVGIFKLVYGLAKYIDQEYTLVYQSFYQEGHLIVYLYYTSLTIVQTSNTQNSRKLENIET